MSAYELDDDMVRQVLRNTGDGLPRALRTALEDQVSLARPDKIGAVVETDHSATAPALAVFIRWASDVQTDTPWILREELDRKEYGNAEIGRIVTILSEGVDV